ncbi:uncharacterized protein LOC131633146 [Vicia villosa]|uniref:uncharacterized protein LOC131633146 n=1 Tax=Vicia villosa TaxID=3911 RepID=UPI00273C5881|nr:uncharacterized protein LOC131633146 [Vicia villosa]
MRGGGSSAKRKRVGFLLQRGEADVCFLQETKLTNMSSSVVKELWGDVNAEWSHSGSLGASGGILTMWKKDYFDLIYSFRGEGGDFNSVSSSEERVGISKRNNIKEMEKFKNFIEDMEVVDVPTIGSKFTWFNSNGKTMSRLDRFLLSEKFIEDWKVEGQTIGKRDISDHAPIWLQDNKKEWGPKSFRFNNLWLKHEEFAPFVTKEWAKIHCKGRGDYCLVEKLKVLKERIRWWNKTVYGWIDLNIGTVEEELHHLDNLFVHFAGTAPDEVTTKRSKEMAIFWDNINKKEGLLGLKSRQLWLSEGDNNTRFFHNSLKERRRRNLMCSLESSQGRLEEPHDIKDHVFNHFKSFFKEEVEIRPEFRGIRLKSLSNEDSLELEKLFTEEEVKEAIWACDGNKIPGADGFTLEFSRVGSIYKILAKLLTARIKRVVSKLVSPNQTAFVPGRNMMDGVLMVNEILDWAKRKKRNCLLLKVDFEKAYDSVSWNFIRFIMDRMGFSKRWMKWMEACVFTSHMSVLVNGSATKEFMVQKGLRQADSLSPFIFVLVMEGLTALVKKAEEMGEFRPFRFGEEDYVDILQFADDTIIMGEPTCDNLWNLKVILRGFELVSGLKINFSKINVIGVHVGDWFMNTASSFLSCKKSSVPFKFLGVMVGICPRKVKAWKEVIKNIKDRLSAWKEIRSLQSNFLWSGNVSKRSIHWVSWEIACKPKDKGGLGIRDVREVNRAILLKWKWRILTEKDTIWSRFIELRYTNPKLKVQATGEEVGNPDDSIWWRDVIKNDLSLESFEHGFSGCVKSIPNDGKSTLFWHSLWSGNQPIRTLFPVLYASAVNTCCSLKEAILWQDGKAIWDCNRLLAGTFSTATARNSAATAAYQQEEWTRLVDSLPVPDLNNGEHDRFVWMLNDDGLFSVGSTAILVAESKDKAWPIATVRNMCVVWNLCLPLRIKAFVWRFLANEIPLKDLLLDRNVPNIGSSACVFCLAHPENATHLFLHCDVSRRIWSSTLGWIGTDSFSNLDEFLDFDNVKDKVKIANSKVKINTIWIATMWSIWLMRNAIIFDNKSYCYDVVFSNAAGQPWLGSLQRLFAFLQHTEVFEFIEDSFSWSLTSSGSFSVKSCYDRFMAILSGTPMEDNKVKALSYLWKCNAPSRILFFGWRFILDRIATRDQLVRRGILREGNDSLCALCLLEEESIEHLSYSCRVTSSIWRRVYMWLDLSEFMSLEDFVAFFHNCGKLLCLNKRTIVAIVWLATVWSIWIKRNAVIFKEESFSFTECMSEIVYNPWCWLCSSYKKVNLCNYYYWNILPLECFER